MKVAATSSNTSLLQQRIKSLKWSLLSLWCVFTACLAAVSMQRYAQPSTYKHIPPYMLQSSATYAKVQEASGRVWGARAAVLMMGCNDYSEKCLISKTLSKLLLSRCSYQSCSTANANSALSLCTVVTHSVYVQVISHISGTKVLVQWRERCRDRVWCSPTVLSKVELKRCIR